ncbi:MAG: kynureninase [Bernardetiaceae bacterium]|nr:kynureninase [Bernardetiaceae bacterium]
MTQDYQATREFAKKADQKDPLHAYRNRFYFPKNDKGQEKVYLCGNSLGLQPKNLSEYVNKELEEWKKWGVDGHLEAENPWLYYHHFLRQAAARIVGAKPIEVVIMNNLTVNLHLMMISFYRPTKQRFKILIEASAFPSDQYAVESQARLHGYEPDEAILEIKPRKGESYIRNEDIIDLIKKEGEHIALVMLGGINYYTGQVFDMKSIAKAAHEVGANVGYDLAHAAGNIELSLHEWNVDFAVWCTYKYLNSGPGGTSGVFVHEKHANNKEIPRLAGWWGHDEAARFEMKKGFIPMPGADGWQLSNAQILPMAAHRASLAIFDEVGMSEIRKKSVELTGYLAFLIAKLNEEFGEVLTYITPQNPEQRGAQLSLVAKKDGRKLYDALTAQDVVADWREPDVIRIAPAPLYNSYSDCFRFYEIAKTLFKN